MTNKEEHNKIKKVYVVTFMDAYESKEMVTTNLRVFDSLEKAQRYIDEDDYDYILNKQTSQTWFYTTDNPWWGYLIEEFELNQERQKEALKRKGQNL